MSSIASLKEGAKEYSPVSIGSDLVCDQDNYNYEQATVAFIHAVIIPLLIALLLPVWAMFSYIAATMFLYYTVFRYKSKEYFIINAIIMALIISISISIFVIINIKGGSCLVPLWK